MTSSSKERKTVGKLWKIKFSLRKVNFLHQNGISLNLWVAPSPAIICSFLSFQNILLHFQSRLTDFSQNEAKSRWTRKNCKDCGNNSIFLILFSGKLKKKLQKKGEFKLIKKFHFHREKIDFFHQQKRFLLT